MAQAEDKGSVDLLTYQGREIVKGKIEFSSQPATAAAVAVLGFVDIWCIFLSDRISCYLRIALNLLCNEG